MKLLKYSKMATTDNVGLTLPRITGPWSKVLSWGEGVFLISGSRSFPGGGVPQFWFWPGEGEGSIPLLRADRVPPPSSSSLGTTRTGVPHAGCHEVGRFHAHLRNPYMLARKHMCEGCTLALKSRADVTRSPNQRYGTSGTFSPESPIFHYSTFLHTLFPVSVKMSEVMSIAMILRPPNVIPKPSTGLPLPNSHECIDTGDGNYTCTGSMNGEYFQFHAH